MRNNCLIKVWFLLIVLFSFINVFASTNTFPRTEDDLRVSESIEVNDDNLDNIMNTPSVNEEEKVYDFADLFSDIEEKEIYNKIISYIDLSKYDLAVVTINENNKSDEVEYADDFYDYNNFGFDESFSGLLFLIDMDNRVIYISTTGYAIKMYDDYRIDRIIDFGYDDLVDGNYDECILKMIQKTSEYYNLDFPESNEHLVIDGIEVYYDETKTLKDYLIPPFAVSSLITLITSIVMYNKTRLKIKSVNAVSYLTNERDLKVNTQFIRSSVSRVPKNTGSSSYGGRSSGGGSSFHSSSSGRSHGGGGRRF